MTKKIKPTEISLSEDTLNRLNQVYKLLLEAREKRKNNQLPESSSNSDEKVEGSKPK